MSDYHTYVFISVQYYGQCSEYHKAAVLKLCDDVQHLDKAKYPSSTNTPANHRCASLQYEHKKLQTHM